MKTMLSQSDMIAVFMGCLTIFFNLIAIIQGWRCYQKRKAAKRRFMKTPSNAAEPVLLRGLEDGNNAVNDCNSPEFPNRNNHLRLLPHAPPSYPAPQKPPPAKLKVDRPTSQSEMADLHASPSNTQHQGQKD